MKAKDAYFLAKRQMQDAINHRIEELIKMREKRMDEADYEAANKTNAQISAFLEMGSFVRNVMLWDNNND